MSEEIAVLGQAPATADIGSPRATLSADKAKQMSEVLLDMLYRKAGPVPNGTRLAVEKRTVDSLVTYAVIFRYDGASPSAKSYLAKLLASRFGDWDDQAKMLLLAG